MKNKIIVKIAHTGTGTHGMGATRWVSDFLLRIDLPQSLFYSFLRVNLTAKLDWLGIIRLDQFKIMQLGTLQELIIAGYSWSYDMI